MSDKWKYVSVGKCVKTIITALIMLCVVFVPISFGTEADTVFTYVKLPYIGDGSIATFFDQVIEYIVYVLPTLGEAQLNLIKTVFLYSFYGYFLILGADILFSLILILLRSRILRKIFEILSILIALSVLVIALSSLAFVVINVLAAVKGGTTFNEMIFTSGVTTMFAMFIFSIILFFKQFRFFKKPY